jgi:hypothetical protein
LAAKFAAIEDIGERAFEILKVFGDDINRDDARPQPAVIIAMRSSDEMQFSRSGLRHPPDLIV